ncbi:MAG TPA: hypothetical protein PKA64_23005, partial [Myxococcota bacterium]|nr:hypothetical protein [Myxococcota bacterium]
MDQLVQRVEAEGYVETDRSLATRWFTRLPPVGALPADFLEPRRLNSDGYPSPIDRFFPAHIRPIVEPVPASQVDALMAAAAPLDPIDLSRDAAVGVSVVVPDDLYEPELLVLEQVAPEFYQMLSAFDLRLQDILWRRTQLRDMLRALQAAADGLDDVTVFADPDPDAVTGERVGFGPIAVDPSAPYIEVRDPNDPRYFIESIRAAGTLDGLDWGTLFSILVGPNAQRWVRVLTDAALAAEGMRERRIVLRVGTTDRVDLALTVPARPAARWMINDKVLNRVDRPTSRFELRPAVEGWDSSLSTTWQERDPGSSMVVIAAKLDDDALRNLQALPYTDRSDAARGPVAVLPPLDEPDPDRWYSKLNPEAFSLDRPLLVQPDALIVLPSERDESSKGIRMVPDANLTTVELGGLSGPEDPLFCDLSFAVDVVNQLLADPYAAFQDDALWWRVCSRVTGAEAECETALCEGGRVAADFKAMQLRLAQSDSGLGPDDVTLLTKLGLRPWIEVMQERIRRAESSLTLSFTRCQAGIYAARQLVLGAEAATRTTTSPVLATIGLGTTETATKQESTTFAAYVAPAATRGLTNGGKLTLGLEQAPPEAPAVRAAREKLAKAGFDSNAKILRSRSAAATLGRARAL